MRTIGFLISMFWGIGLLAQCPTGLSISTNGWNIPSGNSVCIGDSLILEVVILNQIVSTPLDLALYWDSTGNLNTKYDVYSNATLIEEDITPLPFADSTFANNIYLLSFFSHSYFIYAVTDPDNAGGACSNEVEVFELLLTQGPILRDTVTSACVGELVDFIPLSNDVSGLSGPPFEYYNTLNDAQTGTGAVSGSETFNTEGIFQRFYRRVSNGCSDIARIDINILPPPEGSNILFTIDEERICTGDSASIQVCGLEANTVYNITYDKQLSPPLNISFNSGPVGCFYLPTNPIGSTGSFTYEIEALELSSGCGIAPNPIPNNMKINVQVNGRPEASNILDYIDDKFCYNSAPVYELSGLDNNTDYTIQYSVNGSNAQSFFGTSDGSGNLFPHLDNFTEDLIVDLLDVRYNDGDTECSADPPPDNSASSTVLPDLSAITLVGDTICEDPSSEATITFQNVPKIGQKIDFALIGDSIDQMFELPINADPEEAYTFPYGVNINAAQAFTVEMASIAFRNAPECLDDTTRNSANILVSERPIPNFDDTGIPCITHERTVVNMTEPMAARSSYAYQWVFEGNMIGTEETLVYNFPGRPASLPLKLIAKSGNCIDSVTKDIFFDNGGPEIPEVAPLFREDTDGNRMPGAILLVDNPDTTRLNYQWYFEGSPVIEKGDRHFLFVPSFDPENPPASYSVEASFKNPGSGESDCGTRSSLARLGNGFIEKLAPSLSIYPNPNNGTFTVHITGPEDGIGFLKIFDLNGKQVHHQEVIKETAFVKQKIQAEKLKGFYYISWQIGSMPFISKKLVIH